MCCVVDAQVSTLETKERLRIVVKEGKKHEVRWARGWVGEMVPACCSGEGVWEIRGRRAVAFGSQFSTPSQFDALYINTHPPNALPAPLLQQVRQLVAAAGFEVQSLKRVRIGGLRIPTTLGLGSYK